jgi:hypothetical protein
VPGFRGRNRRNATLWTRTCEVPAVDPPKRFVWRTLPTRLLPDSTEWTFELADSGDHTRLTQSMRILHIPGPYEGLFAIILPSTATAPPTWKATYSASRDLE